MDYPDLPWPRCLGIFDEESCRYFLHELGLTIVPYYPFSFGIEEVTSSILKRYGWDRVSDPISILQELLEDEENAGGLGDDGDPWRSWRHSWRHRNIDPLNCFILRVGHLILPRPTSIRIRRLKAENFTLSQQDRFCDLALSLQHDINIGQLYAQHSMIPVGLLFQAQQNNTSAIVSDQQLSPLQQDLLTQHPTSHITDNAMRTNEMVDIETHSISNELDPAILLTMQALAAFPRLDESIPELDSTNSATSAISPSMVRSATLNDIPRQSQLSAGRGQSRAGRTFLHKESSENVTRSWSESVGGKSGRKLSVTSSNKGFRELDELIYSPSVLCPDAEVLVDQTTKADQIVSSEIHDSRATNRQARLVDGTILTPLPIEPVVDQLPGSTSSTLEIHQTACNEQHLRPTKSNIRAGKALVLLVLNIFRPESRNKFLAKFHERYSMPATSKATSISRTHLSPEIPAIVSSNPISSSSGSPLNRFGLDGTTDSVSDSSSYTVYLNKPLPLNPEDVVRSLSDKSYSLSARSSPRMMSTPSTTSSCTPSLHQVEPLSTNNQRSIPKTMPQHELPPISEVGRSEKYAGDPPKGIDPLISPKSFRSVAGLNPWIDNEDTELRNVPKVPIERNKSLHHEETGKRPSGLTSSCSAPAIHPAMRTFTEERQVPSWYLEDTNNGYYTKQSAQEDRDDRGRSQAVSSPSRKIHKGKPAAKINTNQPRSRSPIKRMLWPNKNNNCIDTATHEKPAAPHTPEPKQKSKSMKRWGEKIRHGFLTPDLEQLKQEELIDQHMNTPQASRPKWSTFPVSMEPPHQAKINSEIELMVTVTANRYLLDEAKAGRVSGESVARIKGHWHALGRPEVIEFHYDQISQHDLIVANLKTLKLHGDAAKDPLQINSILHGWKIVAKEMSIRTFCLPDSVIRKHLHDAHRVLELLGAPIATLTAFDGLQVNVIGRISTKQQQRMLRKGGNAHTRSFSDETHMSSTSSQRNTSQGTTHREYAVEDFQLDNIHLGPSPVTTPRIKPRKPTGAEGAIMELPLAMPRSRAKLSEKASIDPYDSSRGGRLGKIIQEKPEDVLL